MSATMHDSSQAREYNSRPLLFVVTRPVVFAFLASTFFVPVHSGEVSVVVLTFQCAEVCGEVWVVGNNTVTIEDGDFDDYRSRLVQEFEEQQEREEQERKEKEEERRKKREEEFKAKEAERQERVKAKKAQKK